MKKKVNNKMTLVIGSSRLGAAIANVNSDEGVYTSIIDKNEAAFKKVDSSYSGFFIVGNAEEYSSLLKAHIEEATEVDVVTGDDDTNIFVALLVVKRFPEMKVIVRLHDEKKRILLDHPHISIISPSSLSLETYMTIRQGGKN